jgi:hypothetical protein
MDSEWIISGQDAEDTVDMIATVCEYAQTQGFPGFIAWLDQRHSLPVGAEDVIRTNLGMLQDKIKATR